MRKVENTLHCTHATGLAVRSRTTAIAVGLTRTRVDRDCKGDLQDAGLTKPAKAYFGYEMDCHRLGMDAIFLFYPCPERAEPESEFSKN
jgi:hypothetical protein